MSKELSVEEKLDFILLNQRAIMESLSKLHKQHWKIAAKERFYDSEDIGSWEIINLENNVKRIDKVLKI